MSDSNKITIDIINSPLEIGSAEYVDKIDDIVENDKSYTLLQGKTVLGYISKELYEELLNEED